MLKAKQENQTQLGPSLFLNLAKTSPCGSSYVD